MAGMAVEEKEADAAGVATDDTVKRAVATLVALVNGVGGDCTAMLKDCDDTPWEPFEVAAVLWTYCVSKNGTGFDYTHANQNSDQLVVIFRTEPTKKMAVFHLPRAEERKPELEGILNQMLDLLPK